MSKKIIYLLSLLMALSLVFASCKKNPATNPGGELPGADPGDNITPPTDSVGIDGLFTEQGKLDEYNSKYIQRSEIAKYANKDYMRNPVITVVDDKTVVIFYEIRYQSPGSGNDTALTGTNVVDIVYTVSENAGMTFDTSVDYQYVGGSRATDIKTSHGAPVVFYHKNQKKLVVVASAGIGLAVGSEGLDDSRLEYSVATVDNGKVGAFGPWKTITKPANLTKGDVTFTQFGTHSARGTVTETGTLLLPVTVGKFINNNGWGDSRWGYLLYTGTVKGDDVTWTEVQDSLVVMNLADKTKATRIASGTDANSYVALTVSDASSPKLYQAAAKGAVPTMTGISAGDGAAGTLVVDKWIGGSYNPAEYKNGSGTTIANAKKQAIFSHVEVLEKQLAIRLVDEQFRNQQGTSFIPNDAYKKYSKSSTLDILGDGTIVMAAEGGKIVEGDDTRTFYIHFYRFSQAYLANQTGNAAN